MENGTRWFFKLMLVALLSTAVTVFALPLPQSSQEPVQSQPSRAPDDAQQLEPTIPNPNNGNSAYAPGSELPDAPAPAPVQPKGDDPAAQTRNPTPVPSGAAAAKAAPVKGAPASRPIGSAIAPAKQRERRSLLIKVGLVAGACVAVGSAFALSKASPAKPPGAP